MYCNHEFSSRWWLSLVTLSLFMILGLLSFSNQPSAAQVPEAYNLTANRATLIIQVNYAQDWVAGVTDPGVTVSITIKDNLGILKAEAVVSADGGTGDFFVACEDWFSGWCPNIVPGDQVFVLSAGANSEINPIGAILIDNLDASSDTVTGTLDVDAFTGTELDVTCEIWEEFGPMVTTQAQADGGSFSCSFNGIWDIQPGDIVAVTYYEPDGDQVITIAEWPWMRVNLDSSQVGGNYHAGQNLTITVTDSMDAQKAVTMLTSDWSSGWGGGEGFETQPWSWWPSLPEIIPGDRVGIAADNGYTHNLEAGFIDAEVDAANNRVMGTIVAPPSYTDPLKVECHPWGAWESGIGDAPIKESWAEPDGTDPPFLCQWDPVTEWDIQPGQEIGVMYIEPDGDRVIDVFEEPAPYLRVEKQGFGELTQGGNARYRIKLLNEGSAPAENVLLTDAMDGLEYLEDTSGLAHSGEGSGPITWDVGTLEAGYTIQFDLFAQVTASDVVTNTIAVTTSTTGDQGEPWEKTATWVNTVILNDTYLRVGKNALTNNPAPGQDLVFVLGVCNDGKTASSAVTLSDDLDAALSLVNWWSDDAGWTESSSDSSHLVVTRPTIDSGTCSSVHLRAHLASTAPFGDLLANTAQIDADNDLSPDDNQAVWEGQVDQPQLNVRIDKGWIRGQLVPSGEIHYLLRCENTGNVPLGALVLTDTFPINTSFLGAWILEPWGRTDFLPDTLTNSTAEWQIPAGLENGGSVEIELALVIDPDAEPGTPLVNAAAIDPLPGETNQNDNAAQWSEVIYPALPNLRIHKWHEWLNDGQLLYKIQFENIGSEPVEEVQVTDLLPADTEWDGWQMVEFLPERLVDWEYLDGTFQWSFSKLLPGESGWILFRVNLTEPGTPLRWFTNSVEITLPDDDPNPADNFAETVAFSGGEVQSVNFWLNPIGSSSIWGEAIPDSTVTVITPLDTFYAFADPECNGCWQIEDAGLLGPGDIVTISADQELLPVEVSIPDPFTAEANCATDEVSGQVAGWFEQPVEIHGEWLNGFQEVLSDPGGYYSAAFPDIPCSGKGYVRVVDVVNYADVSYHLPFEIPELVLEVNYSHDGIEGLYEPGHTVSLEVTDHDFNLKATAELETQEIPWWEPGQTGFSTHLGSPWVPSMPDIVPGDWVYVEIDNGQEAEVQIGEIDGTLDISNDIIEVDVYLYWLTETLQARCSVWEEGGPIIDFEVESEHGSYSCDLGAQGWDLQRGHHVAVQYQDPEGHWVINVFSEGWQIYLPFVRRGD